MILKAVSMSWLTVVRMMQVKGGFRSPEDIRKTPLNPDPNPKQLEPNERVERIRRIQLNDLENLPFFLTAGLLFVSTEPSLLLARWLLYGYVVSRLLHFAAYFTADPRHARHPMDRGLSNLDLHDWSDIARRAGLLMCVADEVTVSSFHCCGPRVRIWHLWRHAEAI
jgi:glutathione S-transferase